MLVLKRKVGEVVKIGNDIEIQILALEGDVIKLGFNAPKHVQIMRSELYDAIRAENIQAGNQQVEQSKQLLSLLAKKAPKDEETQ
jgi:carbon storage regulator (csrA)